jgi:hypothetical protein
MAQQNPTGLGGAFKCSSVGMDGRREGVLEMQRLKYAPVNPTRELCPKQSYVAWALTNQPSFVTLSNLKPFAAPTFPD